MSDSMEIHMLKQQMEEMKNRAGTARSATLNAFLDLKVMIEEGDYDEALEMLEELT